MSDRTKQKPVGKPISNPISNPMHANTQKSVQLTQLRDDIKEQDEIVGDIEQGVDELNVLAHDINTLSKEQDELVNELGKNVDEANSRVKFVTGMVNKLIEKSGGQCRCATIVFLVVAFFVLLFIIVFV